METIKEREFAGIDQLKDLLLGSYYAPGDQGFEAAHACWNVAVRHTPKAVVLAKTVADVQHAVRFASENNLKIAVQTTGHGQPKTCDGLLINLREMTSVSVNLGTRTAKADGGALWLHVIEAASSLGLAPLNGSSPHIGVVGYTIGGGFGIMLRKYGLAIDSVRSFEMVTADAEVIHASPSQNADIFWAVCGGGGGFGIITQIEFQLYPQAEIYGGAVLYPSEKAAEVLTTFTNWTKTLPKDVTATYEIMTFPPVPFVPEPLRGKSFAIVIATSTLDETESETLLKPIRNLGGAAIDTFRQMPYRECGCIYNDPIDPLPAAGAGVLLKDLTENDVATLIDAVGDIQSSPNLKIQIRHLGGAMQEHDECGSCAGQARSAQYLIYMLGVPGMADPAAIKEQAERVFSALGEKVITRGPLNFVGEGLIPAKHIEGVYTQDQWLKLQDVKEKLDPDNRFSYAGTGITDKEPIAGTI